MATAAMAKEAPRASTTREKSSNSDPKKENKVNVDQKIGVAVMVVLLVLSLFVGNFRALQKVTPQAFFRQGDVASIVDDRISAAKNIVTVAGRAEVDKALVNAVNQSVTEMETAKTARELSRADQTLITSVSELTAAANDILSGTDARSLTKAADNFTEQGSFLRQEAKAYNAKAQKAIDVYNGLPTKFLFGQPDYYEGI